MTTITTASIKERLQASFNGVKPLKRIETPVSAKDTRTITVINFNGIQLICGVYSLADNLDTCEYQRFLYIPETAQTFTF